MSKIKKIDPAILYQIIREGEYSKIIDGYKFIQQTLLSSDDEDGGGEYGLIIQEVESQKYYAVTYNDWDMDNTDWDEESKTISDRCDLTDEITEVQPKQKTITVYE